ncbi:MAG: hypothetical protein IJY66_02820 [Clostridia bacterium]|nr:hypothetical protein [Clostridia bacterium]
MVDFKNGKIICDNGLVIDKHLHLADLFAATWEEGQFFSRPSYYSGLAHIELHNVTSADGIEVLSFEIPKNGKITGYSIYPTDCFPATFPEYDERIIIQKKMEEWLLQHQKAPNPPNTPGAASASSMTKSAECCMSPLPSRRCEPGMSVPSISFAFFSLASSALKRKEDHKKGLHIYAIP